MIKELYLENWKSHEKSLITFDRLNLIIGRMGSGKTSIVDAISYAFFGNFSDLSSKKIKLEDIITKKPREKTFSRIILKFTFLGKEYEILRLIEKNKGSYAEIKENGKIIRSGTMDTNSFIEKLLKINFKTFLDVIYAEQNKIGFFLDLERNERKTRFDQMIGIEKLERMRKTSVSVKNRLLDISREKSKILSQIQAENLDEKLRSIDIEIVRQNQKIIELEKNRKKIEEEIEKLNQEIDQGKRVKKEIENLTIKIIERKSKIEKMKEILRNILSQIENLNRESIQNEIEKLDSESKNLLEEIKEKEEFIKKFNSEINSLLENLVRLKDSFSRKTKLESKRKEIEEIEKLFLNIKSTLESLKENENFLRSRLKELEIEKTREEKIVEILKGEFSICPICESEISNEKKNLLIKKHSESYRSILSEIKNIEQNLKEVEKKLRDVEKKYEEILIRISEKKTIENELRELENLKKEDLDFLENRVSDLRAKISEIQNEIENNKKKLSEIEVKKKEKFLLIEKMKQKEDLEKEIKNLEKEISTIEAKVVESGKNLAYIKLEENEKILKEKEILLRTMEKDYENAKKILSVLNERREEILIQIKNREKLKSEIEHLERIIEDLNILENSIKEAQLIIRGNLIEAINYYLSVYWRKIYPYRDYIDARFVATEDDYIMQLKDSLGRWIDLDKIASGGERTLAAICLRIAFSKVLAPTLNIIIFDEPTHNLDREAISQLAKIINESFPEIFDQVFIITHDESFKSIINANVIKVERNKIEDLPSQIITEV